MEAFIFALNAILPIILLVALGYILKKIGLLDIEMAKKLNKLVFRVFLPAMLFLNVYGIDSSMKIGFGYIIFGCSAAVLTFGFALISVPLINKRNDVRATLAQASFRSNYALIGIPLAASLFGAEGAAVASLLSAFSIPIFNILAVLCFSAFSGAGKPSIKKIALGIAKNPLIISIALGGAILLVKALFLRAGIDFRIENAPPIYKTLTYLSSVATPIALISLGAQFEFSDVREFRREIIFGVSVRTLIVPTVFLGAAYLMGCFSGAHFAAFVALFATPIAVSSVPMAQELGGESRLAGQLVVWTTILSSVTIFAFSFILKLIGVF
jgi:predicted permease